MLETFQDWKFAKQVSSLYLCIFENVFEKAKETFETGSILCENCRITGHSLLQVKFNTNTLPEICEKIQKNATELYKQSPKTKQEHIKLLTVSIGVDVVVKIDDTFYVSSIIKSYSYFSFVFCCAKEGRVLGNNETNVATLKILR